MSKSTNGCCSSGGECCETEQEKRKLRIDFLYLDLSVCERYLGTESNLDRAVNEVSAVLKAAGFEVVVNKVNINSKELAVKYKFISSPTIRINGNDIIQEAKESSCTECGDLCGEDVECRVWEYEGKEYNEPPKEMIVNSILKEVYGQRSTVKSSDEKYVFPNNLEVFFNGIKNKN